MYYFLLGCNASAFVIYAIKNYLLTYLTAGDQLLGLNPKCFPDAYYSRHFPIFLRRCRDVICMKFATNIRNISHCNVAYVYIHL